MTIKMNQIMLETPSFIELDPAPVVNVDTKKIFEAIVNKIEEKEDLAMKQSVPKGVRMIYMRQLRSQPSNKATKLQSYPHAQRHQPQSTVKNTSHLRPHLSSKHHKRQAHSISPSALGKFTPFPLVCMPITSRIKKESDFFN